MGGGSRGKKKPKLRDLSINPLTLEEQNKLSDALAAASSPIAQAILGAVLVEHELEASLRRRLSIKDDGIWKGMLDEQGSLSTFARKISMGFALKLYDEAIRDNLDIVRVIRNAFAHSKQLIDFAHPLVHAELQKVKIPGKYKRMFRVTKSFAKPAHKYASLCVVLGTSFSIRVNRSLRASSYKFKRKSEKRSTFYDALAPALGIGTLGSISPYLLKGSKSIPLSSLVGQIADPKTGLQPGLLSGMFAELPKTDDKTGK